MDHFVWFNFGEIFIYTMIRKQCEEKQFRCHGREEHRDNIHDSAQERCYIISGKITRVVKSTMVLLHFKILLVRHY